jgi:hypothetical protein
MSPDTLATVKLHTSASTPENSGSVVANSVAAIAESVVDM